jgi:hypothetical protein
VALAGRGWRHPTRWGTGPGAVALVVSALAFSALLGHVAQMAGIPGIKPFASFGMTLFGIVVAAEIAGRRSGQLRPVPSAIDLTAVSP